MIRNQVTAKLYVPILLIVIPLLNIAQTFTNDKNRFYEFLVECPVFKCNINGKTLDTALLIAPSGAKFVLVDLKNEFCVIRFTMRSSPKIISKKSVYITDDYTTYSYYSISKAQLDFKTNQVKKTNIDLVLGTVVTPIKLRFNPFDFSKDISVGSTFGIKYTINEDKQASVDGLIGFGVSTVTLDSSSTLGHSLKNTDLLAFTPSFGLVLELGNAQVGIFLGFDFISHSNQIKYDWIYQTRPWLSFGIGYSMFSFNLKKNT